MRYLLVMTMLVGWCFAGTYSGGTGSSINPYRLSTSADYKELVATPNDWNVGYHFILTANIDCGGDTIAPIGGGSSGVNFIGVLDGKGFVLSNIVVDSVTDNDGRIALFGKMDAGSIIKNLVVRNVTVSGQNETGKPTYVAILVAENPNGAWIDNCDVSGSITHTHTVAGQYSSIGIIAGANHGIVMNSTARGTISAACQIGTPTGSNEAFNVGGVVGLQTGLADRMMGRTSNCLSSVVITSADAEQNSNQAGIGGICGQVTRTQNADTSYNYNWVGGCSFLGSITWTVTNGQYSYIGGIVGYLDSKAYDCESICTIDATSTATTTNMFKVGGLVGNIATSGILTTSFADAAISVGHSTISRVGGAVGMLMDGDISDCYAIGTLYDKNTDRGTALDFERGGGFAGSLYSDTNGTVTRCFAATKSPFTAHGSNANTKGFAVIAVITPTNCFWDKEKTITATDSSGVTGLTTANMAVQASFTGFDFAGAGKLWTMGPSYPMLDWQFKPRGGYKKDYSSRPTPMGSGTPMGGN